MYRPGYVHIIHELIPVDPLSYHSAPYRTEVVVATPQKNQTRNERTTCFHIGRWSQARTTGTTAGIAFIHCGHWGPGCGTRLSVADKRPNHVRPSTTPRSGLALHSTAWYQFTRRLISSPIRKVGPLRYPRFLPSEFLDINSNIQGASVWCGKGLDSVYDRWTSPRLWISRFEIANMKLSSFLAIAGLAAVGTAQTKLKVSK